MGAIKVFCAYDKMVKLSDLRENPDNPNRHPESQIDRLVVVLAEGWRLPITVSNLSGLIVRGHGRFLAAKKMGLKEVPVDYQDYKNKEQEIADLLADNKIPELSFVDSQKAVELLNGLRVASVDLLLSGYSTEDLMKIEEEAEQSLIKTREQSTGKIKTQNKFFHIRPVLTIEQMNIVEEALKKTGNINRGAALTAICGRYLEEER